MKEETASDELFCVCVARGLLQSSRSSIPEASSEAGDGIASLQLTAAAGFWVQRLSAMLSSDGDIGS